MRSNSVQQSGVNEQISVAGVDTISYTKGAHRPPAADFCKSELASIEEEFEHPCSNVRVACDCDSV